MEDRRDLLFYLSEYSNNDIQNSTHKTKVLQKHDPHKKPGWIRVLRKGKQFLLCLWRPIYLLLINTNVVWYRQDVVRYRQDSSIDTNKK